MAVRSNSVSSSRKIASLGVQDQTASQLQLQLQAKIRLAATQFLKEHMIGLPSLPSVEELEKAQKERQEAISKRIELEKKAAIEEQLRSQNRNALHNHGRGLTLPEPTYKLTRDDSSFELVSPENGWTGESEPSRNQGSRAAADQADPMLVQINRVRNYIKQARAEHRYDEVNMLESNLRELEIEYFIQSQKDGDVAND